MEEIRRLLVANRSEMAIRIFRAGHELGIGTIALYTLEDRYALHRFKADEAYEIGTPGEPIKSYLDVTAIVSLAVEQSIDAIHPGYGFLSESPALAEVVVNGHPLVPEPPLEQLDQTLWQAEELAQHHERRFVQLLRRAAPPRRPVRPPEAVSLHGPRARRRRRRRSAAPRDPAHPIRRAQPQPAGPMGGAPGPIRAGRLRDRSDRVASARTAPARPLGESGPT